MTEDTQDLLARWRDAKAAKEYQTADSLREELRQQGIEPQVHHGDTVVANSTCGSAQHSGWRSLDRLPPNIDPAVGDWHCVCGNWNWARRENCNKCGGEKPKTSRGTKRRYESLVGVQSTAHLAASPLLLQALQPPKLLQTVQSKSQLQIAKVTQELQLLQQQAAALAAQQEKTAQAITLKKTQLQALTGSPQSLQPSVQCLPVQTAQLDTAVLPVVAKRIPADSANAQSDYQAELALPASLNGTPLLTHAAALRGGLDVSAGALANAPANNATLLELWAEAKRAKDFVTADGIREMLREHGIEPTLHGDRSAKGTSGVAVSGWRSADKLPPNIDPAVGDWHCLCGNWNWARREVCNKCGGEKNTNNKTSC